MKLPFDVTNRQKDSREAADAGLLLWRENFIFFLPFFAVPLWICAFALRMLPDKVMYLSWIILWLLKPFFDRLILHVISIRFFESSADFKRLLQGLGKTLTRGLLGDLLWRRFSPFRSAMMPVRVLEPVKKSDKETAQRRQLLKEGGINFCFLLTLWGIALEIALLVGEILFFAIIADLFAGSFFANSDNFLNNAEVYIFAAYCLNYILIETIYVCMGFSLYINSRINVEGWDIEIMFRSFVKKSLTEKLKDKKISCIAIIFCLLFIFFPAKVSAADWPAKEDAPLEALHNILASPDFGGEKDSWGIKLKKPFEPADTQGINFDPMLERLRIIFASVLRFIMFTLIAVLAVLLFFYMRKLIAERNITTKTTKTTLHGISAKNPDELLKKAVYFFEHGNLRMAWGYCTSAAILSWSLYRNLVFPPNATESECINMVRSMSCNSEEAAGFCTLINHWINFAYAGQLPPTGSFEEASAFCKSLVAVSEGIG